MRKYVCATLAFTLSCALMPAPLRAQDAGGDGESVRALFASVPALTKEEISVLREGNGKPVTRFFKDGSAPALVPAGELEAKTLESFRSIQPDFGVETLILAKIPSPMTDLQIYGTLLSVGTMEGITYFSASRNRDRLLFEKSWRVAGENDQTRLPDPVPEKIPDTRTMYILQKDLTFGQNIYRAECRAVQGSSLLSMRNLTPMKYGIIPAVGKEGMRISVMVVSRGNRILFYGAAAAEASLPLFESRARESFQNRIIALYDWFINRIGKQQAR